MEETISLKELMGTLKKRIRLIILITLTAVVVSGAVSFFLLTPIYQSSTQLLVNQSKSDQPAFDVNDIRTNLELINTYNVIIKSPAILDKVAENLNMERGTLNDKITVGSENQSQVLTVSVTDANPNLAASIANEVASVFQEEIPNIMNVDNVSVLAQAEVGENQSPIKPQPVLNIAIAMVVGLMAGVGLAFLLEYLDNTIKTEQDVEKLLGLPVLGSITTINDEEAQQVSSRSDRKSRVRGESVGS
ncbi:capsular biosynthesis protein [Rossellomorea vietnamensis]|uniref:Capsular biosynthesis protein n=1 Tax=Rossellomorea vietnamensis TaxID=218284 RepID=A0A5D4K5D0_9BACI|nr:Wzz/FepE/Etk N-terminal domain-containing protein [Rossellomorea vietnamensis]TYR72631.1 capsular biosynthesis protein [Rossellomorea vietnamensis]